MSAPANDLAIAPLGAGDLIDRAVRLYRRHFLTLIRIAAPPVVISAAGSALTTIAFRAIGATPSSTRLLLYLLVAFGGGIVIAAGSLFSLIVMGGATRNLVAHSPVVMKVYHHPKEGWTHREIALANAKNRDREVSLANLKKAVSESERLAKALYGLYGKIHMRVVTDRQAVRHRAGHPSNRETGL